MRLHRFLALGLALALPGAGCAEDPGREAPAAAAAVVDDAGSEVRLSRPPTRIISLIPAVTELVVALGVADRLVARTEYDHDPALARLPSVGEGLTPSVEWLVRLHPELVVAWPDRQSRSVVGRLAALGIPVYGARIETLEDIASTIRRVGLLLGVAPRADSLAARVEGELDAVRRVVAGRERPSVLYVVSHDPPMTAGPTTFIDGLIAVAGGRNAFADARAGWPQVGLEEIVRRQPDVLIVPLGERDGATVERVKRAPGWRELRAVKEGRVYGVDAEIFNRPGPRVGEVARRLAAILHPEAFPEEATP